MGIDTQWVDENSKILEVIFDHQNNLATTLLGWHERDTFCLRFIDHYGDTVFNQAQLPKLLEELAVATLDAPEAVQRQMLTEVISLVEKASGEVHTYIKFVGD